MNFKIDGELIKISKNSNNGFWKPLGMFYNISEISIEGEWFKCGITHVLKSENSYIQISHPMKVDNNTLRITKVHTEGIYKELKISNIQLNLLNLYLNRHKLNYISFEIRNTISERRNTFYIFSIATVLSIIYFIINEINSNSLMEYISKNNWLQTLIIFITISGFINIFYPFTIKKQIEKSDIKKIVQNSLEEDERNKEVRRRASI